MLKKPSLYQLLCLICLSLTQSGFSQNIGSPEHSIKKLYTMYKEMNTSLGKTITSGKFLRVVNELDKQVKVKKGKLFEDTKNFSSLIQSFKIIETVEKEDYALVAMFWILNSPNKHYTNNNQKKIQSVQYLMKKVDNDWKITNARLTNEYNMYDQDSVNSIRKKIVKG